MLTRKGNKWVQRDFRATQRVQAANARNAVKPTINELIGLAAERRATFVTTAQPSLKTGLNDTLSRK
jgi:hypothetical protein